jgi:Mg2+ and Co2+ transporter CorA
MKVASVTVSARRTWNLGNVSDLHRYETVTFETSMTAEIEPEDNVDDVVAALFFDCKKNIVDQYKPTLQAIRKEASAIADSVRMNGHAIKE